VAESNPYAWSRNRLSADEIWQPAPTNRMISWPYTKLMNSNNMVDQAAVILLASAEASTRLAVPQERWVFPYAGTDSHDTFALGERADYTASPAIRIAGRRALELAGCGTGDIEFFDIYSCFPSAVQVAAAELGLPLADPRRPLTVTGGLTFAGGPWNNYVTHSIGTMAERLIEKPGSAGLITANGGYLTKHSIGVYSSHPSATEFRWEDVQSEVDGTPTRVALAEWEGVGTVEAWTTPFDRNGQPEKVFVAVRTPGEARTLSVMTSPSDVQASVTDEIAGAKVKVEADGTATLR
jgi:acetyl-CoA C-acetyltransferase